MVEKGLRRDQVHRLLEDIETLSLAARLLQQALAALDRDMKGMLNGNNNKEVKKRELRTKSNK